MRLRLSRSPHPADYVGHLLPEAESEAEGECRRPPLNEEQTRHADALRARGLAPSPTGEGLGGGFGAKCAFASEEALIRPTTSATFSLREKGHEAHKVGR